jgi:hypothetical protein
MSSQRKEEAGISAEHVFPFSLLLDELYGPGAATSTHSLVFADGCVISLKAFLPHSQNLALLIVVASSRSAIRIPWKVAIPLTIEF